MTNLKLRPRLAEICNLIEEGSKVIDVGADHALLDIYLSKYKNCTCLAIDKSINCVIRAINNSVKYDANILVKQNEGLDGIELNDEIIVISGVGTRTIKKILDRKISNDLIIVSHTDIDELEKFLIEKKYQIVLKKEIYDRRYYKIIKAKFI